MYTTLTYVTLIYNLRWPVGAAAEERRDAAGDGFRDALPAIIIAVGDVLMII